MARRSRLVLPLVLLLAACGPRALSRLDSLKLHGTDTRLAARGVAYGPDARQRLDVYVPDGPAGAGRPVVVFFYGGSWSSGSRQGYAFAGRGYASQGFVAVVPDYRLVPRVRFPAFVQDGALALRWVRDHAAEFGGDPRRITVAGHSAGAYIGAMLALDPRYLRDAGVGPGTIRAAALMSGPYHFRVADSRATRDAFGAWPRYPETQPLAHARPGAPPMWLATGTLDRVVRPRNSEILATRLSAQGNTAVFRQYQGLGHADLAKGLSLTFRGRAGTLADSAAFLRDHSR